MDAIEASKIIADEYAAKILAATYTIPKSAIRLSSDLGIPIAACYRRIRMLEKASLIRCEERVLTQKGKRMSVYVSVLKNAFIFLENGKLRVRFEMKSGCVDDYEGSTEAIGSRADAKI
jgi:hypothetical protein